MPDDGADKPTGPTPKRKVRTPSSETKPAKDPKANTGKKDKPEPTTFAGKLWHNWVKPIGSVVIIVILLRSTLLDWNDVPTGSMEPEIHVGDRIAVNRLAYALQCPLTGPKIGIPFIGPEFDNPLDGIPQLQWGKPARGDIVTFWNPVTKVRMVKRIVAEPGDTISMSGGVMTINGETATYEDIDALVEGLPVQTRWASDQKVSGFDTADLEYRKETLLGETRLVQHIKERWLMDAQLIEFPNGERLLVDEGFVQNGSFKDGESYDDLVNRRRATPTVIATAKDGVLYLEGKPVDYNAFVAHVLEPYSEGSVADQLAAHGLEIKGHDYYVDGEAVSMQVFSDALKQAAPKFDNSDRAAMQGFEITFYLTLQRASMTNLGPITIAEDQYLMVGDNRNNSSDGRAFGTVDRGEITGEAFAVAFSFKDNKMFALPPRPAWTRFFKDLE